MAGKSARLEPWQLNLGQLFQKVRDAVVVANAETGRIVLWNPSAERLLGYKPEEIIDELIEIIVPERLRMAHSRGLQRFVVTGRGPILDSPVPIEVPALAKSGAEIPVELTLSPIEGAHVPGPFVVAIIRDVRERHEKNRAQQEAIDRLERLDEHKDRYISFLSHELRTPIQAIMGFGNILEDELLGSLTDPQRDCASNIVAAAEVLHSLVNDLLDLSRIQAGTFALDLELIEVEPIVSRVLETLKPLATLKRQTLEWRPAAELPALLADHQRVGQVLMNLVNNAIKYSPEAGAIRVTARSEGGAIVCEVVDSGSGIAPGDLPELFKPFSRVAGGARHVPGTGLGLSIVKELVTAHGGTVGVRSTVGAGSTFWFALPVNQRGIPG